MRTLLLALVLAACGGSDTPATTPQPEPQPEPAAAPTCASASAHAVTEMNKMEGAFTAEQAAQLEALFATSCAEDQWSEEAIRCVAESTGEELERCEALIPEATHRRVAVEIEKILGESHGDDVEPPPP